MHGYGWLLAIAVASIAMSPAQAGALGKPGLWESTVHSPELDQARAQMTQQMARMPPAQRAQMEAMMNNMGVGITPSGATRVCVTDEMAKDPMPAAMPDGCKGSSKVSGRTVSFEYSCQDGAHGRGEFSYPDDRSYTGWTDGTVRGRHTRVEHAGRWISADCGSVKPLRLRN